MVEELKLAIKIDDASIEQSLLKQFANAQKMADKVVLDFRNVNFDNKQIEAKFKEMQKKAGQNPIDLTISDNALDMLGQIDKRLTEIFSIGKGKSFIDSSSITADIRKIENKINELNKKINTSFDTKNKTEAYNQLKKYADAFKEYYGNEEAMATNAGAKAGYAYYKAYEEALRKGVAQSKLEKVTVDFDVNDSIFSKERIVENRIKEFENFQKYGNADESNLIAEITLLENRLLKFNSAYSQVKANLGDAPITPEITKNIEEYVRLLEIAESRAKDAELFGYSSEDINSDKDLANMYLDFAKEDATAENKKYIESLKQEETQAIATAEAEQKLAEAQKETVSNTSNSNNSQIEELKSDIQEVKTELGDVKDRISSIESNGFENVRDDVEKTKESVKELNSEFAEMKSNLSSTPQESNISLASDSTVKQQIKSESELNAEIEKRENIIRELQQLQEKLTVHEDFHDNDRYFADQLPTEEEIREADKRIKQLTGTNNIFDVDKLIQDRNEWLSEVKYSLEEYDDLIKANDQKALDEYTTRGLSRIGGAESFFGYEDNNFSIASKFVEEKEKIQNEINDLYTDLDKLDEKMNLDSNNSSVDNIVQSQEKLQSELKETQKQAEKTTQAVKEVSSTASQDQTKDAFPNADAKPETEGMKQVEEAIHNAVQAKKDFATANEGVQSSIDDSENPLKLEAELMGQIAKSAREAADAKKEFVEANKQVKNSADGSNSENKKKDKYAKRRKISEEDFLNFSPSRVNENLSNSGYTILGETVNTELVDGLVKVSAKIKDVDGVWKSFSAKVDADGNIFEQRFKTVTNGVDKLETALKNFGRETSPALTYQETLDKAQKIKNSLNLGDEYSIKVDSSEFVTITKKLTDVENTGASVTQTFKSAQDAIDNFGKSASNSAERTSVALKSVKSNIKEVTDESEKLANAQKEQNVNANLNKYDKQLDSYNGKVDKYQATIARFNNGGWTSDEYLDNVQAVKDAVKKYEDLLNNIRAKGGITSEEDIQNLKEYESEIKNTIATVTNMSAAEKGYNFVSGQKELDKIHKLLNENSKMSSEAKAKIKAYYTEIESGNPSMSLDRIHGEIMKIYNAEVEAGRAGRSFFDTLKNSGFHQLAAQMSGMFGFYDVINLIKQAASAVTELNTQITELAKVSEDSVSQIYADFDSYANIAKEMGSTISDTIAATTAWSKNGYNIPDSKELAEVSLLYKNVGDGINIDEANESLVSTLKGFKLEADQAEHIVDVFNEVSNREPISSSGIGEALQRSAASFNAANTSLEKSVALVTATNSVLQDPEKVGNMWKTVSARIRGAKTELEEAGEDTDGMVESTSKLQALIKGMTGFDIMESDGKTFKDIYDIIIGIGKKWQDLNDVDRASLLEKLAGKNQSNALAAALSQVDLLKKAYGEATNAEGSAREENSKYQQSVQYSIDQTKAKLEELANDTLNSKFLKGLINAGGKIIDILDIIIKNVGILKPLIAGLAIKNIVKNFD